MGLGSEFNKQHYLDAQVTILSSLLVSPQIAGEVFAEVRVDDFGRTLTASTKKKGARSLLPAAPSKRIGDAVIAQWMESLPSVNDVLNCQLGGADTGTVKTL